MIVYAVGIYCYAGIVTGLVWLHAHVCGHVTGMW
jgi:hypothetical protein